MNNIAVLIPYVKSSFKRIFKVNTHCIKTELTNGRTIIRVTFKIKYQEFH